MNKSASQQTSSSITVQVPTLAQQGLWKPQKSSCYWIHFKSFLFKHTCLHLSPWRFGLCYLHELVDSEEIHLQQIIDHPCSSIYVQGWWLEETESCRWQWMCNDLQPFVAIVSCLHVALTITSWCWSQCIPGLNMTLMWVKSWAGVEWTVTTWPFLFFFSSECKVLYMVIRYLRVFCKPSSLECTKSDFFKTLMFAHK